MISKVKELIKESEMIYQGINGLTSSSIGSIGIIGHNGQPGTPGLNHQEYIAWCRKQSIYKIFNEKIKYKR